MFFKLNFLISQFIFIYFNNIIKIKINFLLNNKILFYFKYKLKLNFF